MKSDFEKLFKKISNGETLFAIKDYVKIGEDKFEVSTVDLGFDCSMGSAEKPLYYETIVFDKDNKVKYMNRYSSVEEAIKGHNYVTNSLTKIFEDKKILDDFIQSFLAED